MNYKNYIMDSMEKIIDFSNKKSKSMIQCLLNIKQIRGIEYGKKYRFK